MLGHVDSVGVPSSLKMRFSWSSTSLPGKRGRPAFASSASNKTQKRFTHPTTAYAFSHKEHIGFVEVVLRSAELSLCFSTLSKIVTNFFVK